MIYDNPYEMIINPNTPKDLDNRDKEGEWLETEQGEVYCSKCNCKTFEYNRFNYCSVCGAKMIQAK